MDAPATLPEPGETLVPQAGELVPLHYLNHVLFGAGALDQLGRAARDLGAGRALVVTDPGIRAAGHVERAERALWSAGIQAFVFDDVEENPTTAHVGRGLEAARRHDIDCLVGLGGGSSMDCAKGINFLLTNGGCMEDYWGSDRATKPMLPSIGIPTTAGTGSEAQSYAVIEQEGSRRKMACGDAKARFRKVILDPELTASMPTQVAALSGMDAVSHALESYVTTRGTDRSRAYARSAWSLLEDTFEASMGPRPDVETRGRMLFAAHQAGVAIELSMLGAAHACANPLTSRFEVPHGAAVLLMLPHVIRFNEAAAARRYRELVEASASGAANGDLAARVEQLRTAAGLPTALRDLAIDADLLPSLAADAADQWTARFNPRPVTEADLLGLYEAAY